MARPMPRVPPVTRAFLPLRVAGAEALTIGHRNCEQEYLWPRRTARNSKIVVTTGKLLVYTTRVFWF